MKPKICAVIPSFNGARFIGQALESVREQVASPADIIVVDNASTDETAAIVAHDLPGIRLKRLSANLGFGRAANIGMQMALAAGADYVWLMNQDVIAEPNVIARLCKEMDAGTGLGLLSAFQLSYDGARIDTTFCRYAGNQFWDDLVLGTAKSCYEVSYMPAAAVLLRRSAIEDTGGFDPLFFMYGEDDDFCRMLGQFGWKIGFAPEARVKHWHGLLNAPRSWRWRLNWEYSRALLHLKWSRRPLALAFLGLFPLWLFGAESSIRHWPLKFLAILKCLGKARAIRNQRQIGRCRQRRPAEETSEPPVAANRSAICA
jgi:GT2 family glycosyltransferase